MDDQIESLAPDDLAKLGAELLEFARLIDTKGLEGSERMAAIANQLTQLGTSLTSIKNDSLKPGRISKVVSVIDALQDELEDEQKAHQETKKEQTSLVADHKKQMEDLTASHAEEVTGLKEKMRLALEDSE